MTGRELRDALITLRDNENIEGFKREVAANMVEVLDIVEHNSEKINDRVLELSCSTSQDDRYRAMAMSAASQERLGGNIEVLLYLAEHLFPEYIKEGDSDGRESESGCSGVTGDAEASS